MKLKNKKQKIAKILKVGTKKVKLKQDNLSDVKEAITNADLRALIAKKSVIKKPYKNQSRSSAKKTKLQKSKGRRKGVGSRKGKPTARLSSKRRWMLKVRTQRKFIKTLLVKRRITKKTYRDSYLRASSNRFRNIRLIKLYLEENKLFVDDGTQKKKKG